MIVDLNGRSVREARASAHRLLEATDGPIAAAPRRYTLEPALAKIARARERAKDDGTKRCRAALETMLEEWRAKVAAIVDRRLGARATESLREADEDDRFLRDDVLKEIVRDLLDDEVVGLALEDELHALFAEATESVEREIAAAGDGITVSTTFDGAPKKALAALDAMELRFSKQIVDREVGGLKALIRQSLEEGWSNPDLAGAIKDYFAAGIHYVDANGNVVRTMPSDAWATMVARTESSRAYNAGSLANYRKLGVVRVRWIAAEDERTCPLCDMLDGETNAVGENWPIAEVEAPPAHVLCRCTIVAVWSTAKVPVTA